LTWLCNQARPARHSSPAGAPPDKAAAASEELAAFETRQSGVEAKLTLQTWMIGAALTLVLALLGSQFLLWARIGEMAGQLSQILARLH
jgi:type VI protein secretion system component VasF